MNCPVCNQPMIYVKEDEGGPQTFNRNKCNYRPDHDTRHYDDGAWFTKLNNIQIGHNLDDPNLSNFYVRIIGEHETSFLNIDAISFEDSYNYLIKFSKLKAFL